MVLNTCIEVVSDELQNVMPKDSAETAWHFMSMLVRLRITHALKLYYPHTFIWQYAH